MSEANVKVELSAEVSFVVFAPEGKVFTGESAESVVGQVMKFGPPGDQHDTEVVAAELAHDGQALRLTVRSPREPLRALEVRVEELSLDAPREEQRRPVFGVVRHAGTAHLVEGKGAQALCGVRPPIGEAWDATARGLIAADRVDEAEGSYCGACVVEAGRRS